MSKNRPVCSRREFLGKGVGGLLATGLWPGKLFAGNQRAGSFHFLVVNDLHCLDERDDAWLARVVARMKEHAERPAFCMIAGDLAENGTVAQLEAVRDAFRRLGLPVFTVPGNHDYLTMDDRSAYEGVFPQAINYRFEHEGWQFLCLDTTSGQSVYHTLIQAPTFAWLERELPRLDRSRPTILFTHFPLINNVLEPLNARGLLERLDGLDLRAAFGGHWHGATSWNYRGATLVTGRCCALHRHNHGLSQQKGYLLGEARADGTVGHRFIAVNPAGAAFQRRAPIHRPPIDR